MLVDLVVATDVATFLVSSCLVSMMALVWIDGFVTDKCVVGNVRLSVSLATAKESDRIAHCASFRFGLIDDPINW